jgi:hypothetical protein
MACAGEGVPGSWSMNAPTKSRQFPILLNEPLARFFLLRPEIFMNPDAEGEASAREFRIGAWATPLKSDRLTRRKIPWRITCGQ